MNKKAQRKRIPDLVGSVENILAVFDKATPRQVAEGVAWYPEGNRIARDIGEGDIELGAGILAALSPRVKWSENIAAAYEVKIHGWTTTQLQLNVKKAAAIRNGAKPLDVLGGKKVRAFYQAILQPGDQNPAAVIDRHAVAVWVGASLTDDQMKPLQRVGVYEKIAQAYSDAAALRGVSTHTVQAVTWVAWRESK